MCPPFQRAENDNKRFLGHLYGSLACHTVFRTTMVVKGHIDSLCCITSWPQIILISAGICQTLDCFQHKSGYLHQMKGLLFFPLGYRNFIR